MECVVAREEVSEARLLAILNERLAESPRCEDCNFPGPILRLEVPDERGCNWDDRPTLLREGQSTYPCAAWALRVVQEASKQYNLA